MDTVNTLKNKNVIKLRSKKLRSKKLRIQKLKSLQHSVLYCYHYLL